MWIGNNFSRLSVSVCLSVQAIIFEWLQFQRFEQTQHLGQVRVQGHRIKDKRIFL